MAAFQARHDAGGASCRPLSRTAVRGDNANVNPVQRQFKPVKSVEAAVASWLGAVSLDKTPCVAFSGGIDSSVLLHALVRLSHDASRTVSAIHVHHGLSAYADAWAAHCERTCRALGIALTTIRVQVNAERGTGIEAAAREARYEALRIHAQQHATQIALAHHARDQAETVLLQLLRGAGPAGLAAMPEHAPAFARPLLKVSKDAIDRYAKQHEIEHIVDDSNTDARFARNRLRLQVWPALTEAFSSAETTLARAATWQREADVLAFDLAQVDLARCADNDALLASKWSLLSSERRRNALRHWLIARNVALPSANRLREWEKQLLTHNATQNLVLTHASFTGSIRLYRDRIQYILEAKVEPEPIRPSHAWNGETTIQFGKKTVQFQIVSHEKILYSNMLLRPIIPGDNWILRLRRNSDKIALSPKSGSVLLKNIFQAYGVPPWQRAGWPILTCNGVIAALPGLAIAHEFRGDATTGGYALSCD